MTRRQFFELFDGPMNWGDLIEFCFSVECGEVVQDIYDEDAKDDHFNELVYEWAQELSWYALRDRLDDIPDNEDWYFMDPYDGLRVATEDDYDNICEEVMRFCDENNLWETEDNEEQEEEELEEFDVESDEMFDCMIGASLQEIHNLEQRKREEEEAQNKEFQEFVVGG